MILAARLALAVVVLAVADDAFIHPEPGTGAGDHLAGGLVPMAVAVALGIALPRLPALARGAALLVCGALAVVAGVADGVAQLAVGGPSGDDLTATAAALAGVVLLVLGVRTFWLGRRREGTAVRRWGRRVALAVGGLVLAYLVVLPVALAIVATHGPRHPVADPGLGRAHADVTVTSADGVRLRGWYVPSRNGAAVLVTPGRVHTLPAARMLARRGFGVLLLDARGQGASDGDRDAFGWRGAADVEAAVGFLRGRPDVDPRRIGGLGLSVGGESLLQAAARDAALRAVVSEGAGRRSLAEQLDWPDVPVWQRWISPMVVQTAATAVLAGASPPPSLSGLVSRVAPRGLLLIRALDGHEDEVLNRVYARADGRPGVLWETDGGHTGAQAAHAAEYDRRVAGFLERALSPSGRTTDQARG